MGAPARLPEPSGNRDLQTVPVTYNVQAEVPADAVSARFQYSVGVLYRHFRKIVLFVGICVTATAVISSRLTPIFEAAATIDIDRQMPAGVLGPESSVYQSGDGDQYLATQLKLIQSDSVLRPVAARFNLALHEGETEGSDGVGEGPVELKGLRASRLPNTSLIQIRYRSPDPRLAANVANAIAEAFIQNSYTIRYNASVNLSTFMESQLTELKAKMDRSSVALARFERELNVIDPEQKTSILATRLMQLNSEYTNAQADRVKKEAAYNSVKAGASEAAQFSQQGEAVRRLTERLDQAEEKFAQVKAHYGANHPEYRRTQAQVAQVKAEVDAARQYLLRAVEVDYRQATDREKMLKDAVAQNKAELDGLNARSFQYRTLKHDAETDRKLYEELTRKVKEAGINAAFHNATIRLADAARPPAHPVFPKLPLNVLLAFLFSSVIGICAAFVADALDHSVRDAKQAARVLNTVVAGTLPVVRPVRREFGRLVEGGVGAITASPMIDGAATVVTTDEHLDIFNDAIRVLLNSILLGSGERPLRSLLISSAFPKEGKTTVATHLAMAHARQKHRTLLIDGDMRCPSVASMLSLGTGKGFSYALNNGLDWRGEVVTIHNIPDLDVLAAGPDSKAAADVIGAELGRVLKEAESEYDLVVVDAPPMLGFPEPLQMAAAVDGVIVVAVAGQTHEEALDSLMNMLQRIRANVLGVVMNQASHPSREGTRYYGYTRKG